MFSCEFCEISKNTFSYRIPPVVTVSFCILYDLIKDFVTGILARESRGFEFTSTITFVFQANRQNKYASHPKREHRQLALLITFISILHPKLVLFCFFHSFLQVPDLSSLPQNSPNNYCITVGKSF